MSSAPTDINDSNLGELLKLPPELRLVIYDFCFANSDHEVGFDLYPHPLLKNVSPAILTSNMGTLLAPLQVCRQMRHEALESLLGGKTVVIYTGKSISTVNTPMVYLSPQHIASLGALNNRIPVGLRSPKMIYEIQHDCRLGGEESYIPPLTGLNFAQGIDSLVTLMQPCELVLSVNFFYRKMSSCSHVSKSYHGSVQPWNPVCARDKPMNPQDCEQMLVKFSARNTVKAHKQVAEAFAEKRRQLEVRRSHRMCQIRVSGIDKSFAALAIAENMVNEMIGHLTPTSLRYRAAGLLKSEGEAERS